MRNGVCFHAVPIAIPTKDMKAVTLQKCTHHAAWTFGKCVGWYFDVTVPLSHEFLSRKFFTQGLYDAVYRCHFLLRARPLMRPLCQILESVDCGVITWRYIDSSICEKARSPTFMGFRWPDADSSLKLGWPEMAT
jgi:hypothetical protein